MSHYSDIDNAVVGQKEHFNQFQSQSQT